MAHHSSTPQRVLDAPKPTHLLAWDPFRLIPDGKRRRTSGRGARMFGPFVGNVQRDLLDSDRPERLAGRRKARHARNLAGGAR